MSLHLNTHFSIPLEREFEAWTIAGIEEYCLRAGLRYSVFAVGPTIEKTWPADEALVLNSKLFGLQFKQAKADSASPDRLKWLLHQPKGQFALVKSRREIFYCLPTFINRAFRQRALDHCLFWRPDPSCTDMNVWYDNSSATTPNRSVKDQMRWGYFVEQLLACRIGTKVNSAADLGRAVESIQASMRELQLLPGEHEEGREEPAPLYLFSIGQEG